MDDSYDARDSNCKPAAEEYPEIPVALDNANEKALSRLGVEERWKYREARQVVM